MRAMLGHFQAIFAVAMAVTGGYQVLKTAG